MSQAADNQLLIQALKNGDASTVKQVYHRCFPMVAAYVQANSGNKEDVEDVFQEAWMVLLHKVKEPDFVLTSLISTYVFSIAKNIWLHKLRTQKRHLAAVEENTYLAYDFVEETHQLQPPEAENLVQNWLQKITKNCQVILTSLFINNMPMNRLMQTMGWKNKHTAANQKYKCLQQMKNTAMQDINDGSKK